MKELGQTAGFRPCFHVSLGHFGLHVFEPQPFPSNPFMFPSNEPRAQNPGR